jgi:hypothetical protein
MFPVRGESKQLDGGLMAEEMGANLTFGGIEELDFPKLPDSHGYHGTIRRVRDRRDTSRLRRSSLLFAGRHVPPLQLSGLLGANPRQGTAKRYSRVGTTGGQALAIRRKRDTHHGARVLTEAEFLSARGSIVEHDFPFADPKHTELDQFSNRSEP